MPGWRMAKSSNASSGVGVHESMSEGTAAPQAARIAWGGKPVYGARLGILML